MLTIPCQTCGTHQIPDTCQPAHMAWMIYLHGESESAWKDLVLQCPEGKQEEVRRFLRRHRDSRRLSAV